MKNSFLLVIIVFLSRLLFAQNQLAIPPVLTGTSFNLNIQNGITQFYPGINTPTYGINGALLAPTLIVNKGDWVTMNVTNNLTGNGNSTTIHWHGMHVPAMADGGPHQVISQGTTWSPNFQILNSAGTYWYHPHGDGKTDLHVSKGLAGMLIVKDSIEAAITLPRTYGVDDFPVIVQSKAFDVLNQIASSTNEDTAICVNGTMNPFLNTPAQVVRFRILNGSSMRTYNFGFTGNMTFTMIASDGGLLDSSISLTRIRLSPGERAEILLDLQGMTGQTLYLNAYNSELPNGIYGAKTVTGMMGGTIPDYNLNPLNGKDFEILQLKIVAPTVSPVTTLPKTLSKNTPWTGYTASRTFNLRPDVMMDPQGMVDGPFNINGVHFDIKVINVTTYLNTVEKWRITNNTGIAHPFHIHDMPFYLLNINGGTVPAYEKGKKDVVLVMPFQYVEFITKFEDFADPLVPYMYHCHLLHHEDDGMMGSFRVIDTTATKVNEIIKEEILFTINPNPVNKLVNISITTSGTFNSMLLVTNYIGQKIYSKEIQSNLANLFLDTTEWLNGIYFITLQHAEFKTTKKIVVQHL